MNVDADVISHRQYAAVVAERDQARRAVDALNMLLREVGWGQGEIDSAATIAEDNDKLRAERDALQAFKTWVHEWLDANGVPHDPDPDKTTATGCRIGGRLEYL